MKWPVVIKSGPSLHQTLATVKFDYYGAKTDQETFVCDEWSSGFIWAKSQGYRQALFVNSGTIITDWPKFCKLIDQYPHCGLIAHLIWKPDQQLYLDDQCWFMNIDQFDLEDFTTTVVVHPVPARSSQNLHDDYTPLWIKPTVENTKYSVSHFGQGLIARQLCNNLPVVNWNNAARDLKSYLYHGKLDLSLFQNYKNIAENQLWIFNNEPVIVISKPRLISPGSGLSWMLNITDSTTVGLQIVDISCTQINFCRALWNTWNGQDYGTFVWNFIQDNQLIHYEVDNPELTALERLQLKSKTKFVQYVNLTFDKLTPNNFTQLWQQAQQTKQVNFYNGNLISWVLDHNINLYDHVWCSNILNYKWTLLHTTPEQYASFKLKLKLK
jgi:hypothetical protein